MLFFEEWGYLHVKDRGCAHGPTGGRGAVWPMLKKFEKKQKQKKTKRSGPRTEPWKTPVHIAVRDEDYESTYRKVV